MDLCPADPRVEVFTHCGFRREAVIKHPLIVSRMIDVE